MDRAGKDKILDTHRPGRFKSMRRIVLGGLIAVVIAVVGMAIADAQDFPRIRFSWYAPDTGSPVQIYELRLYDIDGGLDTTFTVPSQPGQQQTFEWDGEYLRRYRSQVRGIDALGRPGPWSALSDTCVFEDIEPEP
ncbi:MAG: hypothetical protein R3D98_10815 [Candidatus Krumholzibacteriia bacterium]